MRDTGTQFSSRSVALDLLIEVLGNHRPLQAALASQPFVSLDSRDRAFVRRIVATTLRRLGQIDVILDLLLDRPLSRKLAVLRNILRLGLAQLLFDDVPGYAAVDSTVALARTRNFKHQASLANAVLRRAQREAPQLLRRVPPVPTNTPEWLWRRWVGHYGETAATAIADQHLAVPPIDLTVPSEPAAWAERLRGTLLPTGSIRLTNPGRVEDLPGYADGAWWVQDAAAAIPARLIHAPRGTPVLDLCAAPGGKTAQLAAAGARVTAVDRAEQRLATLQRNLQRLRLSALCVTADAATYRPAEKFSHILLDAPCTATGTLRRNPDIAWTRSRLELEHAAKKQTKLLRAAASMLAPNGVLVYAVCSLQPEEGEQQIEQLLTAYTGLKRAPITPEEVGGMSEIITAAGDLRTLPCHLRGSGGLDGFFVARLRCR